MYQTTPRPNAPSIAAEVRETTRTVSVMSCAYRRGKADAIEGKPLTYCDGYADGMDAAGRDR